MLMEEALLVMGLRLLSAKMEPDALDGTNEGDSEDGA
jgi:hypothetical protein